MEEERKEVNQETLLIPEEEISRDNSVNRVTPPIRKTVTVELNRYGGLYNYPGTTIAAKTHSKTYRIGEFQDFYERQCDCCRKGIPTRFYSISHRIDPKEFMKYGIDLTNFFVIIQNYYYYIIYFYMSYVIQTICSILIFGVPDINFNIMYIELYYQYILYEGVGKTFLDMLFNIIRIGIVVSVYLSISRKLKKTFNIYRKKVYDEFYIDEGIYSMFVKNLPKVFDKEDFLKFMSAEYDLGNNIRDVIVLKDVERICNYYSELEMLQTLKKRMNVTNSDLKYDVKEFEEVEGNIKKKLEKLSHEVGETMKEVRSSGTAIVIFERSEEKNKFFRRNFHLGIYCCFNFKKPHVYKGKKLFFESLSSINQIDWKESKYSLDKTISGNSLKTFSSLLIFTIFSALIFMINFYFSQLKSIDVMGYNILKFPFFKAFSLIIISNVFENIILFSLAGIHLSDKYFREIIVRYILMQKTLFNTVIINILLNQRKLSQDLEAQYISFIYFVLLLAFRAILFTRFSENYVANKIKYFILTKILRRKLIQVDLNELYSDNVFSVIKVFEKYRLVVYTSLFMIKLYPLCAVFLFFCIIVHFYVIKWSLFHSCLKDVNYYGYYFNLMMRLELSSLILIIIVISSSSSIGDSDGYFSNVAFFLVSDINNLFHFRTSLNLFTVDKSYSEMEGKFKKRFKDEKFVNLNLLKNEIDFN